MGQDPYHTPQPGMPTVWMMLITTWAMKTKKKAIKLKELSVLQGDTNGRQWFDEADRSDLTRQEGGFSCGASSLKSLVNGPEPAHVGAGREQDEPQESHAEVGGTATSAHPRQTANQIDGQSGGVHCQCGGEGGGKRQQSENHPI